MTNSEMFKTPIERRKAYNRYFEKCEKENLGIPDEFEWLDLEHKEEPEPCPFCGNKDIRVYNSEEGFRYASCCGCGCRTDIQTTDAMAIAAWNRRAT